MGHKRAAFPPKWNYCVGNLMEAAINKKKIPKVIVTRLETVMDDGHSVAGERVNSLLAG